MYDHQHIASGIYFLSPVYHEPEFSIEFTREQAALYEVFLWTKGEIQREAERTKYAS